MEKGLSRNVLKIIAIVSIIIGHFFLFTLGTFKGFGLSGTLLLILLMEVCFIGPPIFMFFISEGFQYTSSKKRYALRLGIFALITQVITAITVKGGLGFDIRKFFLEWNVILALLLGFVDLCILESEKNVPVKIIGILAAMSASYFLSVEWGIFGQLIIIAFYYLREKRVLKFIAASLLLFLSFFLAQIVSFGGSLTLTLLDRITIWSLIFGIIGIALVSFFYYGRNGKKNNFIKYSFYILYPLHLLLIDIVKLVFS
jgi:hypothetical protein